MKCPACGTSLRRGTWKRGRVTCAYCHRTWNVKAAIRQAVRRREKAAGWTWWRRLFRFFLTKLAGIELLIKYLYMRWKIRRTARRLRKEIPSEKAP